VYVQSFASHPNTANLDIDVGFAKLQCGNRAWHTWKRSKVSQAEEMVNSLELHYKARINEAIIKDEEETGDNQPRPKLSCD
jgi:hypothetical protein